jgi:hypothetical protein
MKKIVGAALVVAFSGALTIVALAAHPFLLVQESEYAQIRSLTNQDAWLVMKSRVLRDSTGGAAPILFDPVESYASKCIDARGLISANTMAYIYDPTNSATYRNTLVSQMNIILTDLANRPDPAGWTENVSLGNVLFNSILALDIIYNDLTPGEISTLESKIGPLVNALTSSWELSPYAVKGLWALYSGNTASFNSYRQLYTQEVFAELSADGMPRIGNGYAMARFLGAGREQKALFMDVLEYQGYHDFYTNELVKNAHEYIFGYSTTPFGRAIPFGDTSPADILREDNNAQLWRAYRFGAAAGSYAEWQAGSLWPEGRLTTGLLMDEWVNPPGKLAPSRIFPDGGAFFLENNQSKNALCGALWNVNTSSGHAHNDINALALSGYGQHLLVNSGYCGYNTGALGFSWDYINKTAASGNTVRTDGADHVGKGGAGITAGFTADKLDYACGNAGSALASGTHFRNLLFLQPVPEIGVNGYWVVFDDVTAASYCLSTFHPNSTSITTVTANVEYEALISDATTTMSYADDVRLTTFLGTAPVSVTEKDGLIAAWDNQSFVARYLEVRHNMTAGKKQICTVLFPHDAVHPKAQLTRLTGTGYSGVSVVQGSHEDLNLESSTNEFVLPKCRFKASHTWSRFNGNQLVGYFAKQATKFLDTALATGFTSDQPVTIHMYGDVGKVLATQATAVTIYSTNLPGGSTNLMVQPGESAIDFGDPEVIYKEDFDGGGASLHNTTPTTGGQRWIANSLATDNGILTANAGSAVLPFDPVANQTYVLSMDFNYSSGSGGWVGLGFSTTPPTDANLPNANDRFSGVNVPGYAWMICNGTGITGVWEGSRTANPITFTSPTLAPGPHTLKIVINTAGDGASFTADFFIDGNSVTAGPKTIDAITVADINYVGFTQYGSGLLTGSTVDHFALVTTNYVPPIPNPGEIYTELFDGVGSAFNGKTTTTGGGIWSANSIVTDNGVLTTNAGAAILPFTPLTNRIYTLTTKLNYVGSLAWFGLGFTTSNVVATPGAPSTASRFSNASVPGYAWFNYGNTVTPPAGVGGVWQGARTANPIAYENSGFVTNRTLTIVLNTTGNGSTFTADFLVDGISVTSGPQIISSIPVAGLKGVGFSISGAGLASSMVDDFSLSWVTSSPETAPNFSPGALVRLPNGNISLTATGALGSTYRLWASTNVALTPITNLWTLLSSGTITVSPFTITDHAATNFPRRFYRFSTP